MNFNNKFKITTFIALALILGACGANDANSDEIILISTPDQLKKINGGLDKNYKLINDIDLRNEEWVPIGESGFFSGIFDGQGFTISNLKITTPYIYVGLFGRNIGHIENLVIKNVDINIEGLIRNNIYAGAFIGYNSGYIDNLTSQNGRINIVNTSPSLRETIVGGLVGYTDTMLEIEVEFTNYEWETYDMVSYIGSNNNWWVANKDLGVPAYGKTVSGVYKSVVLNMSADYWRIRYIFAMTFNDLNNNLSVSSNMVLGGKQASGGLIGGTKDMLFLNNSINDGSISNSQIAGGLVGSGKVSIFDSINRGEVQGSSELNQAIVAGLVGHSYQVNINNSQNQGIVSGSGLVGFGDIVRIENSSNIGLTSGVGGLVDFGDIVSIKNSYNTSNGVKKGGLVGDSNLSIIQNSFNSGSVNGALEAGGLIGSTISLGISSSFNTGDVKAEENYAGGLVGRIKGSGYVNPIENTYYYGNIIDVGIEDKGVSINGGGTKLTDLTAFNLAFFTTTLGWDTEIWDFTGLDIANGVYPTLKNMPVVEE
jgi:hypothetical protein